MNRVNQLKLFLKDNPDDAFLNYAMAQEMIAIDNDIEAESIFVKLLNMHPNYTATYYHFGKLLERKNLKLEAINMYKNGIEIAKKTKERHTLTELQSALLELEYED